MAIADSLFDDFYSTYYNSRILPQSLKRAADAFKTKLYQLVNNNVDYVEMYCHYSFATLDSAAGMKQTYMYRQYANNELGTANFEAYTISSSKTIRGILRIQLQNLVLVMLPQ